MTSSDIEAEAAPQKRWLLPLILSLFGALIGGGGGFYLVYSGMLLNPESKAEETSITVPARPDTSFVALEPLVISLGPGSRNRHLRFTAHLEVDKKYTADVHELRPRIMDVLNSYLRAIETSDFEDSSILTRLRAQILRRLQIVTGEGRIKDILIVEFVLN
jgi:flagellar protein FliL